MSRALNALIHLFLTLQTGSAAAAAAAAAASGRNSAAAAAAAAAAAGMILTTASAVVMAVIMACSAAPAGRGRIKYGALCPQLIWSLLDPASPTRGRIVAAFYCRLSVERTLPLGRKSVYW